jgi:electron transfer flavoprotein beta subunit
MMRVIVCVKQVLDPEMPASSFRVDRERKKVVPPPGTPPLVSAFDENAVEAALRLKDRNGAEVFALSAGRKLSRPVVKKPLSAGADRLFLVEDDSFEDLDGFAAARVLAAAISRIGGCDMVLAGRQGADWDSGVTGPVLAELLGLPCVTVARKIEVDGEKVMVERQVEDAFERVETSLPCLITVGNDLGALRQITLPGINKAKKKPVTEWKAADLEIAAAPAPRCELADLYVPARDTVCRFIEAESDEEAAQKLADVICGDCRF